MKNPLRCLALALTCSALHLQAQSDVSFYAVFKHMAFEQEDPFVVTLSEGDSSGDSGAVSFGVFIATTGSNTVSSASVQPAGGSILTVPPNDGGDNSFNLDQKFDGKLALDSSFPNGDFTVTINAVNDGMKVITLGITGDTYPSTAKLSNFTTAQSIDHTSDFLLTWDALVGGSANDIVLVEVQQNSGNGNNSVLSSPGPGEGGQLTGLNTSFNIPAGTLTAGSEYEVSIRVIKPTAMDMTYASGLAGYSKETRINVRTVGSTPAESQAPNLRDVSPPFSSTDAADTSVVTFHFDEPMDRTVPVGDAINWTGVTTPASFVYSWSSDGRTLFCHYPPNHALNTQISWTLNPSGSAAKLQDVAGNDMFQIDGNFTTASSSSAGQTDVLALFISKAEALIQTGSTPVNAGAFAFEADSDLRGYATASKLEIGGPVGGPILGELDHGDALQLEAEYALKSDLDAFFPNGSYTNTITTFNDGTKTIVLDLMPESYPNDPTVQNFSALSTVDSTIALNLSWAAFTQGTVNDFIQVEIQNDVGRTIYESPSPFEVGAMDGMQTSLSIPAHTLAPGRQYECELTFAKVVDSDNTSYAGVNAAAVFAKITEFKLTTMGTPIVPSIEALGVNNGQFQIRVTGEFKRTYTVQSSQDFNSWMDIFVGNSETATGNSAGTFDATDFGSVGQGHRFYRAFEGFSQNQGGGGQGNP